MKKPVSTPRTPARTKGIEPGPFNEAGLADADTSGPSSRQEVRQQSARVNVPRQSERPVERSNQRRSRRP